MYEEQSQTENLQPEASAVTAKYKDYKRICLKLGLFITVMLLLREIAPLAITFVVRLMPDNELLKYSAQLIISALFLQIAPSFIGAFMLKYRGVTMKNGYKKPERCLKAISNFPAIYGFAMTINIITLVVIYLVTVNVDVEESFTPMNSITPGSLPQALILFVLLAIVAPIFEEFIFRGCVLNALKPYGNGLAVFVSAFFFGAMHGNFQQFFYAFAVGIALGYIAVATNSIFPTTILHAMLNAISGILLIFMATEPVSQMLSGTGDANNAVCVTFAFFILAVLLTALIGFILMIKKLVRIRKYHLAAVWTEISNRKKVLLLLIMPTTIIAVLLLVDVYGGFDTITALLSKLLLR